MRHHQNRAILAAHAVHSVGDDAKRIDIQARVGLVEHGQARL